MRILLIILGITVVYGTLGYFELVPLYRCSGIPIVKDGLKDGGVGKVCYWDKSQRFY